MAANIDAVMAVILALGIGMIGILPEEVLGGPEDSSQLISAAGLLALGIVATVILRHQLRVDRRFDHLESLVEEVAPRKSTSIASDDESLEVRFKDLALRLEGTFAELADLEAAMHARAAVARRLAAEAETNRLEAESSREAAQLRKEEADAFDRLLGTKIDAVAEKVDQRGRRTQRRYMLAGVAFGLAASVILDVVKAQLGS
ncbi:hypothetical protein [Nonomuraea cavernae]|uniref:hypothetical protein n=1 Tax=Nonomuraea cavernae TaxID=2045107 RepID=UPI00166EA473|nr:hypothetical protein [Nonomuraea cavernae]MCA2186136.1 hypothetical protein [Nonomuraea cavernae]